jgi:L-lactate dehydrogenase complex protein LldE
MGKKLIVDIFIPCYVDQFYPSTGMNMVKVLEKLGCHVNYNPNQTCCGQPAYNAGFFDEAKEVAVKFLNDFSDQDHYVVAPSASCVGMVRKSYSELFNGSARYLDYRRLSKNIFELSEFLTHVLKVTKVPGSKLNAKATYHDACSALRECGIKEAPRKLLKNVEGLSLLEMKDTETCCGFGGSFAVKFEAISSAMAEQKIHHAAETGAEIIISTDSSCLMQLDGYIQKQSLPIQVMHLADVLSSGW